MLNAFRHQRGKQEPVATLPAAGGACSTPFGIRGENSWVQINGGVGFYGSAQRLSASEGKTVCRGFVSAQTRIKCSTPFGIRGENSSIYRWAVAHVMSAQRLSASEGKTECDRHGVWRRHKKCSTPFGIRGENSIISVILI